MERKRFKCRICGVVKLHAVLTEFPVGDLVVCAQCLGCGVIAIHPREKEMIDGRNS